MLQEDVRNGLDINPRLSKRHSSLPNPDGLLAEWGVHHFHFRVAADPRNPDYVGKLPRRRDDDVDESNHRHPQALKLYGVLEGLEDQQQTAATVQSLSFEERSAV